MLKIWLNLGLNITIFQGTGPRPLIDVRLNFFIPQFKYMKFIHSYFEKGCRKKCTRQSRKVLWVVLRSPLITVQKNLKEWHERPRTVCLQVLKKSNKSRFDSYSVRNSVMITSHISLRDCRVHIFSKDFLLLKQLYSSFIFPGRITNQ